jgi:alpha-D-ribose 1-methylphosphonate 5-phosphate C-P lyase
MGKGYGSTPNDITPVFNYRAGPLRVSDKTGKGQTQETSNEEHRRYYSVKIVNLSLQAEESNTLQCRHAVKQATLLLSAVITYAIRKAQRIRAWCSEKFKQRKTTITANAGCVF